MHSVLEQFDLSGKLALVTGSSAGIGLALAQGLAGAGAAEIASPAIVGSARIAPDLDRVFDLIIQQRVAAGRLSPAAALALV